jgi:DNA repair exonuclease SbcCD ATPase subunit
MLCCSCVLACNCQQLLALTSGFRTAKTELAKEQAASTSYKSAAAQLRQRLVNIRSTGTQHAAVVAATVGKAQGEQAVALAEAHAATAKLQQTKGELQQTKQQLSAERAAKEELTNKSQELQQRLTNMRLTSAKRVVSAAAATAAADAAAAAARENAAAKDQALVVAVAAAATAAVEKERSAAAKAELQEAKQQLVQMQQQHQEQIEVVEERAKAAEKQAAEVVLAAEAAVAQQEGQLQQVRPSCGTPNVGSYETALLLSISQSASLHKWAANNYKGSTVPAFRMVRSIGTLQCTSNTLRTSIDL